MGFTAIPIFIFVATLQYCSGNLNRLHLRQNNARFSSNYSYETKYFEQQVSLIQKQSMNRGWGGGGGGGGGGLFCAHAGQFFK